MRALVYQGPRQLNIENWETPMPQADEIRVQSRMVGICGSDVHGYLGTTGRRIAPMVMGHEMSGIVSDVGKNVKDLNIGDRITVQPILNCGHCEYCEQGLVNICPDREFLGVMRCNGAFEEEFCIPAKNAVKLPASISFETGALIEPFAVGYRAVEQAMPVAGKTAMICGGGTIGLMILKVLKILNAGLVIMVDISDFRLDLAKRHGADIAINPARQNLDEALTSYGIRRGIDIAFEAVGITPTVQQTVDYVKNRGQIIWVGNSSPMVTLNMQNIVTRELNIQGTYVYTHMDFVKCVKLLGQEPIDFSGIISKVISLEEAASAFELLSQGTGELIKVLVDITK